MDVSIGVAVVTAVDVLIGDAVVAAVGVSIGVAVESPRMSVIAHLD